MSFLKLAHKGKNDWWRYVIVSLVILYPFFKNIYDYFKYYNPNVPFKQFQGDANVLLVRVMLNSLPYLVLFAVLFVLLHKRSLKTLITTKKKINWAKILFGFSSWSFFVIINLTVSYLLNPENYEVNFKLIPFLKLLLISFTLLVFRAVILELFFRGYAIQTFAYFFNTKWKVFILSVLLYTLCLSISPFINLVGYSIVLFYVASGILSSLIVFLDNRSELVIGIHASNHIIGLLYIATTWQPFKTDALLLDTAPPNPLYLVYIPVFILFPLYFFMLKKMYRWGSVREILSGKINE